MKTIKLTAFIIVMMLFGFSKAATKINDKGPKAIITYNADKSGTADIVYESSFFVENISLTESERAEIIGRMTADETVKRLEFIPADNNTKLMVILNVNAGSLARLSKKLRLLFTELGVKTVEYNKIDVTLENFHL
jgi:hypothetical protein